MAAVWPTPEAIAANPRTAAHVRALKDRPGDGDLALFGSSTLTASLLAAGVVDELRVMVNPILLGRGRPLFAGPADRVRLDLVRSTTFRNGNALLCYRPAR